MAKSEKAADTTVIAGGIEGAREEFKEAIPSIEKWGQGERLAKLKQVCAVHACTFQEFLDLEREFGCSQTRGGGGYGTVDPASGEYKGLFDAFVKDIPQETKTLNKMVKALSPDKKDEAMALIAKLLGTSEEDGS